MIEELKKVYEEKFLPNYDVLVTNEKREHDFELTTYHVKVFTTSRPESGLPAWSKPFLVAKWISDISYDDAAENLIKQFKKGSPTI